MSAPSILVTGGAGYIGSHVVRQLGEAGESVVSLDDLSTGTASAVLHGELIIGDTGDRALVERVFAEYDIDTVMHFAACKDVSESIRNPLKYYENNAGSSRTLFDCASRAGVRHVILSSTAAVYGVPSSGIATEATPTHPIHPYGSSKLVTEWMLRDLGRSTELRSVTLRYFNVAGADPRCRIGDAGAASTLLTKVACEVAVGRRDHLVVYGSDYPTPDGTGIRDYIHVEDIARAHLDALVYLREGGRSTTLNCGYGHGHSVREVVAALERASGSSLPTRYGARRPGDPAVLIAVPDKIQRVLGWTPKHDDLDWIIETALAWERRLASGLCAAR